MTGLSPKKDLGGTILRLRLRVDQFARLGYTRLGLLNAGNANYSAVDLLTNVSGLADDGEWLTVEAAKGDFSEPAIDMSAIDRIMVRESALAAANVVQTNVQTIETRPAPAAGCLILAFDDGWKGQYANAFPAMAAAGLRGGVYTICDQHAATGGSLYMNRGELRALQAAGWDIGCHADTVAHHNDANGFLTLSASGFEAACVAMKNWQIAWTGSTPITLPGRAASIRAPSATSPRATSRPSGCSAPTSTDMRRTSIRSRTPPACGNAP